MPYLDFSENFRTKDGDKSRAHEPLNPLSHTMEGVFSMVARSTGAYIGKEGFFSGKQTICSLDDPGVQFLCDECSLWYFLFVGSSLMEGPLVKYLGFLDLDFPEARLDDQPLEQIREFFQENVAKFLEPKWPGQWFARFSGSKGFHVYILSEEFLFRAQSLGQLTPGAMQAALADLLPSGLFALIDTSIYANNKGIRPWTQRNPKSGSSGRHAQYGLQERDIQYRLFEWLSATINLPGMTPISAYNNERSVRISLAVPRGDAPESTDRLVDSEETTVIRADTEEARHEALCLWLARTKELGYVPVIREIRDKNIYFQDEDSWCFCNHREITQHKRRKSWWRVFQDRAEQHCIAHRHAGKKFVLRFSFPVRVPVQTRSAAEFDAEYSPGQRVVVPPDQQFLDPAQIEDLLLPEGSRLMVASSMGSGKTYSLNKMIQKHRETELKRILVIGTRQSQCCVYHGAFEGSSLYLNENQVPYHEVPFLVICLNSLLKVLKPGLVVPHYDLLVLDEIMTTLETLPSPLLSGHGTNQPAIFALLKTLLRTSARVVMMDGLPTRKLYEFLNNDLNIWSEFKVLQHLRPGETKEFVFVDNPRVVETFVLSTLGNPEGSVVFVSDSKQILKHMHRSVLAQNPDLLCMTVCGDTDHQIKRTATNPNVHWKHLRYLGYNTALGPGASFDARTLEEGAFQEVVCIVTCKTCSPSEIYQLISRIRWPLKQRVTICVMESESNNNKAKVLLDAMDMSEENRVRAMKLSLMDDIKSLDTMFQSLPLVPAIQTDDILTWTQLHVDQTEAKLVRQLARDQQIRMVYEQDDLLGLLAWARLQFSKFRDSVAFSDELQRLVKANGGRLSRPANMSIASPSKKFKVQRAWMKEVRENGKTRESRLFPSEEIRANVSEEQMKKMTDLLRVEDEATQMRFLSLVRYFKSTQEESQTRFARQIEFLFVARSENLVAPTTEQQRTLRIGDFGRVVSTHTVTQVEYCVPFKELFDLLGFTFNVQTGLPEGHFTSEYLDEKKLQVIEKIEKMRQVMRKINPEIKSYNLDPSTSRRANLFLALRRSLDQIFKWAGFHLKDLCQRNTKVHRYSLDENCCRLRYAMRSFNCDTFEMMMHRDALVYFANKYI